MDRVFTYIARFAVITFGYAVATLTASLFLHALTLPAFGISTEEAAWMALGGLFVSVPFVALFIGYFAFFPAAVLIGLSELAGYRGSLYHIFAGAAVAVAAAMVFSGDTGFFAQVPVGAPADAASAGTDALLAIVATGIVSALAYWMVAGRSAGRWQSVASRPADPSHQDI